MECGLMGAAIANYQSLVQPDEDDEDEPNHKER